MSTSADATPSITMEEILASNALLSEINHVFSAGESFDMDDLMERYELDEDLADLLTVCMIQAGYWRCTNPGQYACKKQA